MLGHGADLCILLEILGHVELTTTQINAWLSPPEREVHG
jgi:site-specific recombinase XerD